MTATQEPVLTVADIAGHLGATEPTVREWIKRGELQAIKFGSQMGYRIKQSEYDAFLARRTLASAISRQLLAAAGDQRL